MSQPPSFGPPGEQPAEGPGPQQGWPPPVPPGGLPGEQPAYGPGPQQGWPPLGPPGYPGSAMPYGGPRFDPADPLVSADFAGWWRRGLTVVRRGWRPLALLQVIMAVVVLALLVPTQLFFDLAARDLGVDSATGDPTGFGGFLAAFGVLLVVVFLVLLIYSIGSLAAVRLVVNIATGVDTGIGRAVRAVLPRVPALIGWSLLAGLIIVAGLFACVLPGLYLAAVFFVLPAVVLFEPGNAISRCFSLFHNDFGAAVARIATTVALGVGITVAFGVVSAMVTVVTLGSAFATPTAAVGTGAVVANSVVGTILSGLGSLVCGIVLTPLVVATYADLRARREAFTTAYLPAG